MSRATGRRDGGGSGYGRTGSYARTLGSSLWLRPVAPDDEVIVVSFDEMRNAALGDGEGIVHASHDGEGGSDHHRPEAFHRHPRKVSKNHRNGAIPSGQSPGRYGPLSALVT